MHALCACSQARKERAEENKDKEEEELDDDEEFADDSDEDDGGKGGKQGKLEGPPVMFLTPVNKKVPVKGRIRETSTIGACPLCTPKRNPNSHRSISAACVARGGHAHTAQATRTTRCDRCCNTRSPHHDPTAAVLAPVTTWHRCARPPPLHAVSAGSDSNKNKIVVKEDLAKANQVDAVHTRIVLEDGHFYLENAEGKMGTYVGLPKKKFFEINGGDQLLLGSAKCGVSRGVAARRARAPAVCAWLARVRLSVLERMWHARARASPRVG